MKSKTQNGGGQMAYGDPYLYTFYHSIGTAKQQTEGRKITIGLENHRMD